MQGFVDVPLINQDRGFSVNDSELLTPNGSGGWQPSGHVGEALNEVRFEKGVLRPFIETDPSDDLYGQKCVMVNSGKLKIMTDPKTNRKKRVPVFHKYTTKEVMANGYWNPVFNATTLRRDEWILFDDRINRAARERLRAWSDLSAANSRTVDGMGKTLLEYNTVSDTGEAFVDMDTLTEGRNFLATTTPEAIPLPITHADFWFSLRELRASRSGGMALDTTNAEMAARRVAEKIEDTLIGINTGITFGAVGNGYTRAPTVYGYINHPSRITYNMTAPTAGGWTGNTLVGELLSIIETMTANGFYGPYMVYTSTDWDQYMDNDYSYTSGIGTMTLRQRLRGIESIRDVRRLDRLRAASYPFRMLVVQMTPDVCEAINGMALTTVQWESMGGMRLNFKVMAIQVPLIRHQTNASGTVVTGITDAT